MILLYDLKESPFEYSFMASLYFFLFSSILPSFKILNRYNFNPISIESSISFSEGELIDLTF